MFEKNAVTNIADLDTYTTNGMYSGLFADTTLQTLGGLQFTPGDTFLLITVNGYAASAFGTPQLTQMLYRLPSKKGSGNNSARMYLRTAYWDKNADPKAWVWANWDRLATASEISGGGGGSIEELNRLNELIAANTTKISSVESTANSAKSELSETNAKINELDNKVSELYGDVSLSLQQGGLSGADYKTENDSTYYVRSDYFLRTDIKNVSVDTDYRFRVVYFDENKNYLGITTWGTYAPSWSSAYYGRLLINKPNDTITTESPFNLVIESNKKNILDEIEDLKIDVSNNVASIVKIESKIADIDTSSSNGEAEKTIDFLSEETLDCNLSTSNKWVNVGKCYLIRVGGNRIVQLQANVSNPSKYAFLKDNVIEYNAIANITGAGITPVSTGNVVSVKTPSDCKYIYLSKEDSSGKDTSFQSVKIARYFGDVTSILTIIEGDVKLSHIGISGLGGAENFTTNTLTTDYLPYELVNKVEVSDGYKVKAYRYGSNFSFIDHLNDVNGVEFQYNKSYKYIRFSITKNDNTDISEDDETGFYVYGVKSGLEKKGITRDFIELNKDKLAAVYSAIRILPNDTSIYKKDARFIHVTDLHNQFMSLDDAYVFQQYVKESFGDIPIICNGDYTTYPKRDGVLTQDTIDYMAKAVEYGCYHCLGQHEVSFWRASDSPSNPGNAVNNCLTHQEAFDVWIKPLRDKWGLSSLNTIYYSKDFDDMKVRLISLYPYNVPLDETETNSAGVLCYKYHRQVVWWGQEQIDWFIQTLTSTPDGYNVIILMHQAEDYIENTLNEDFYTTRVRGGNIIIEGTPIKDIVEAYINKTSLNSIYYCSDKVTYPVSKFTLNVQCDFTGAKGSFSNYFTGDSHVDSIGTLNKTGQTCVGVTSSGTPADCWLRQHSNPNVLNFDYTSIVNVFGLDFSKRFGVIARLGQTYSVNGKHRIIGSFKISE